MQMSPASRARLADADVIVAEVAATGNLAEGEAGVRAVLAALARLEPVSIRGLSRAVGLPVPIVAAVCGELRRRGVVAERRPAQLTLAGRRLFAAGALRAASPHELKALRRELLPVVRAGPEAVLELDQCHCTVETKLRRVLALHEGDALVGRRILLLGDDDLVSVAVDRFVQRFGSGATVAGVCVMDLDGAVLEFLEAQLAGAPFPVEFVRHDVREPLPSGLCGAFDTVVTDPPYTNPATEVFLSRAADALAPRGGDVFLSFGSRRPDAAFRLQRAIVALGFSIRRLTRDFNEYVGAGVLGGTSHLYHLAATSQLQPLVRGRYDGPLYTSEVDSRFRACASSSPAARSATPAG
jgi:predicted methyltransferase